MRTLDEYARSAMLVAGYAFQYNKEVTMSTSTRKYGKGTGPPYAPDKDPRTRLPRYVPGPTPTPISHDKVPPRVIHPRLVVETLKLCVPDFLRKFLI